MSLIRKVLLTTSSRYAIRAVLYIARNQEKQKKFGVKKVAEDLTIPQPFLSKILQELTRRKVLNSTKGKNGGFFIEEEGLSKNLMDVIIVIDGTNPLASCILGLPECSSENPCPLHESTVIAKNAFLKVAEDRSIKEIVDTLDEGMFKL
ncbi:MAG: Rrf2 family transcriptional regulator [Bacteroidia bacterium]